MVKGPSTIAAVIRIDKEGNMLIADRRTGEDVVIGKIPPATLAAIKGYRLVGQPITLDLQEEEEKPT